MCSATRSQRPDGPDVEFETGADPPATPTDAIRVTAVVEAAYESARTGERVTVSLPADARY